MKGLQAQLDEIVREIGLAIRRTGYQSGSAPRMSAVSVRAKVESLWTMKFYAIPT